jgi:uncharacterized membrane protein YhaH (DUF805 family)
MGWYLAVLKKYAAFSGRARRKEYWMFGLFNAIVTIVLAVVSMAALHNVILYVLYVLAVLVPSLAVAVRRLHDTGRSGWWMLIGLVPLVGPIVLLVFTVLAGQAGSNKYGEDPKAAVA